MSFIVSDLIYILKFEKTIENLKAKIESKRKYAIFIKKSIFVQKRKKKQFKTKIK